jgi:methyl-accepting chemotaxis protein
MPSTITQRPLVPADADFLGSYSARQVEKNRRRRTMIDPKLQYSLVSSFFVVFLLASAIYQVAMSYAFLEIHAILNSLQLPAGHVAVARLENVEDVVAISFAAIFCIFTAIIWWAGLRLSHRIAGPIFALTRHLNQVAEGRSDGDISFRRDDYFSDLQDAFNRHMDSFRRRVNATESDVD